MKRVVAIGTCVLLVAAAWLALRGPGRVVYRGGPILTMDADDRLVEALGTDGDRIAIVGSEAEVRAWGGSGARVVDLQGAALLPGFVDAHGHFPGEGIYAVVEDLNSPPIGTVERIDEIVERMRTRAAEAPAGEWVLGMSYDDTLLAERRHPTREDLDRASRQHPLAIVHISGHLAVANSAALAAMDIGAETPDPVGGVIQRDASGAPNGVLEETAAEQIMEHALQPGALEGLRIVREAGRRYTAAGVTTAQSGYATAPVMTSLIWASRLGLVPVRLVLWPAMETADEMLDGSVSIESYDPLWVRIGAVKLVADGSIQGYTGYLSEPYHVPPGDDPEFRGYPRIPREELLERVTRYQRAGLQVAIHGNGDASIADALDAIETAARAHPRDDARPIVIHAQMTRPDQLDRMAELGVVPSFFSLHTFYWGDRHRTLFMGPERAARMSPARSAGERGIRYTIHCDAPVVPMEPLRLVWAAVNRRTRSDFVVGPDERLTPMQALRAVTIDAAWQHFEEDLKGSLEPGKLADLVILSDSPLERPETIDEIRVLETIVGGRSVFRAADAPRDVSAWRDTAPTPRS